MNILVTSAGRRTYLVSYFQEALSGKGKVYASNSEFTIALQEADGYLISPLIYSDNYVEALVNFCKKKDIKAIISVFDIDLLVLSEAKEYIESKGIRLLVSNKNVIETCNDKWETYKFLLSQNIKTPKTYKTIKNVELALKNNEIEFPVVIKPRWGMASMGIFMAEDEQELDVFSEKSKKEIENSYLKYESKSTPGETIIFQEKLRGQEYGVDVINDLRGVFVCALPKSKLVMRAGETDLGETVSPKKFEKIAKKLSETLKHEVILSVDCFEEKDGIYVTEMNCRISGHYPLSHLAGSNLPKQIVDWVEGKPTDMKNFAFEEGVLVTKDLKPVILNNV